MATLTERGVEFDAIEYLKNPLSADDLMQILDLIEDPPANLVRKDKNFKERGLSADDYTSADAVVALLLEHTQLMHRPVLMRGGKAVIARSPEQLEAIERNGGAREGTGVSAAQSTYNGLGPEGSSRMARNMKKLWR